MEKRIELEVRRKNPSQIKELNLDNCRSTSVEGLTDEFINLECLSLVNVGLTNLKGFPKLPNLKKLELSDNRISAGLDNLKGCPKLTHLSLGGNKISTIDILEPLKELKDLKFLELFSCEVTSAEDYREKVFALFPSLKYLDGLDKDNEECDEEEENGVIEDGDSDLNDEDEDDDEDLSEEDDDEENEVGLSYLQNSIDEESEGEDYNPDGAEDSDVDIEDDADEDDNPRGLKRKLEE